MAPEIDRSDVHPEAMLEMGALLIAQGQHAILQAIERQLVLANVAGIPSPVFLISAPPQAAI